MNGQTTILRLQNESERRTDPYSNSFLSKNAPAELTRLRALERWADPTSQAICRRLPLRPAWQCLEMGAGAGSMAYWLAEQCFDGQVVAADIDPRYIEERFFHNLEVAAVDLAQEDFPKEYFDLIHARFFFSHMPERNEILRRAVSWLRPGGAIVIEDYYILPVEGLPQEEMKTVFDSFARSLTARGSDNHWARRIPALLSSWGIRDFDLTMTPLPAGMGGPSDEVWRIGLEQYFPLMVEKEMLTPDHMQAYRDLPMLDAVDVPGFLLSVAGRKP